MAEKLKINVSFPQYDKHIYDFIKSQPNPSAFVRKLVEAYMNGTMGNMMMQQAPNMNPLMFNQQLIYQQQQNVDQEVATDTNEEEVKVEEDIETGNFTPEYNNVDDLDKINELPF